MSSPEIPAEMILTEGTYRPNLASWSKSLPREYKALQIEVKMIDPKARLIANKIGAHAEHIEPYDSVLGFDKRKQKSRALKIGNYIGALLVSPLIEKQPRTVAFANTFTEEAIGRVIPNLEIPGDKLTTSHQRGDFLIQSGGRGLSLFEELTEPLDEITDVFLPNITNHLYAKTGAGLAMLSVWNGYVEAEKAQMVKLAGAASNDTYFDLELQKLLG